MIKPGSLRDPTTFALRPCGLRAHVVAPSRDIAPLQASLHGAMSRMGALSHLLNVGVAYLDRRLSSEELDIYGDGLL